MRLVVKTSMPLLWGVCVLLSTVSMTTSVPENRSTNITVETSNTTRQPTTAKVLQPAAWNSTRRPKEVPAAAEKTASPTKAANRSEEAANTSNSTKYALVVTPTVAEATRSSKLPASTEELSTHPSASVTSEPLTAVSTSKAEAQPSSLMTKATEEAQSSLDTSVTTDTLNHTAGPLLSSTSSFSDKTTLAKTSAEPMTVSSLQPTSMTETASAAPSTASLNKTTPNFSISVQDVSSPTPSSPTSEKSGAETSQSVSTTTTFSSKTLATETAGPASATTSTTVNSTTVNSTSPAGILIPVKIHRSPATTTKSPPAATTSPCEASKTSQDAGLKPCSSKAVERQCLIIIASLAVLATIFMVSTIVLCAKLPARKHKWKRPQQATEMMCISSLLPERTHTNTRHRNLVSNGVLVFPGVGDSDDDGGDDVTLSSFLPDNDRYV